MSFITVLDLCVSVLVLIIGYDIWRKTNSSKSKLATALRWVAFGLIPCFVLHLMSLIDVLIGGKLGLSTLSARYEYISLVFISLIISTLSIFAATVVLVRELHVRVRKTKERSKKHKKSKGEK